MKYEKYPKLTDWYLTSDLQQVVDSLQIDTVVIRSQVRIAPKPQKLYAFEIETWEKGAMYLTKDWRVIAVSAVADTTNGYQDGPYKELLEGKKVTLLGEVYDEGLENDINFETMWYTRELRK